ncbi:MAG: type II toxin-antitoxin system VapC family toxin [Thermoplasmatota archaeon]|nr:type II toxin-antitoxin system VapC family toxin [Halobacteriales archaeon]
MIYIDANVFIYAAAGDGARRTAAVRALRKARTTGAATSALTVDEVVWGLRRQGMPFAIAYGRKILGLPELRILAVQAAHVDRALTLMEKGLQPRDAIHAAVAMAAQADMLSFDPDFDGVPGLHRVKP